MLTKRLQRIGGSVGLILPRDVMHAANLSEGDELRITVVGSRIVLEPVLDWASEEDVDTALAAVIERSGEAFRLMAEYDRGRRRGGR